jgi:hypothetical protein
MAGLYNMIDPVLFARHDSSTSMVLSGCVPFFTKADTHTLMAFQKSVPLG